MAAHPHLSTLLSQVLVAYTIEVDGDFEAVMPHRTALTRAARAPAQGPWLTSLAMWANFLRYVPEGGIAVGELSVRAGIRKLETAGMTRWGYVTLEDGMLRPTRAGAAAARLWAPIEKRVESRWRARLGDNALGTLRSAIAGSVGDIRSVGPDYLPVVGYGLWTAEQLRADRDPTEQSDSLSAVLSRALTVIAVGFERESSVSLALAANVLRVLDADGTPVSDVATSAGVAKEITQVSLGYLEKRGLIVMQGSGRAKIAMVSDAGSAAQEVTERRLGELDASFEPARAPLEHILASREAMVETLTPRPDAWRASSGYAAQTRRMLADPRSALPHFPIVTHRGGYPDGS